MKRSTLATLISSTLLTTSLSSFADDTSRWEGFYGGVFGAYGSGKASWSGSGTHNADGSGNAGPRLDPFSSSSSLSASALGFVLGYSRRQDDFLYGAELDYVQLKSDKSIQVDGSEGQIQLRARTKDVGSLRLRAGITRKNILFFGTVGPAWANTENSFRDVNNGSVLAPADRSFRMSSKMGWAAGAGFEYSLSDQLAIRVEYLHYDFGRSSKIYQNEYNSALEANVNVNSTMDVSRIGVMYSFK